MSARLSAVIVPSGRGTGWPREAEKTAAEAGGAELILVETQLQQRPENLPVLPGEALRDNDIAWRRKEGIRRAARAGARVILLLDDDIGGITREEIDWGLQQIESGFEAAAYTVNDFPDNSSVFHAWRAGGGEPGIQASGAALMVLTSAALREEWRWVPVYCEDWLFVQRLRVARHGPCVSQVEYDPWAPGRAVSEEAGDILAEGLQSDSGLDAGFWEWQLRRRADFLRHVHGLRLPAAARASVEEAREICAQLKPDLLAEWVRAWRMREVQAASPSAEPLLPEPETEKS